MPNAEQTAWPSDARRDRIIGDWYIYQRTGGHRTSTDDLITAWFASARFDKKPVRYLDLGCGIGSVLLMVCHRLKPGVAVGIEAQAQSTLMASRAVSELPPCPTDISIHRADFREAVAGLDSPFDLITGSPPYFPLGTGVLPDDPQRRACRFEERGGVEAYIDAAAAMLTDKGLFYVVMQTAGEKRVLSAADEAELAVTARADFHMRTDRTAPFLTVFELAREPTTTVEQVTIAVRDRRGALTSDYERVRRELGVATADPVGNGPAQ